MKLTEVIRRYNYAWDAHYAEALVNLFRQGGAPHVLQRPQRAAGRHDRREVAVPGGGAIRTGPPRC
jgi:hypothetical protein